MTGELTRSDGAAHDTVPAKTPDLSQKTCWVLTDGRAGIENQALGLAEAIGIPTVVKRVQPKWPWSLLPAELWPALVDGPDPLTRFKRPADEIAPPWPDLAIGTGRLSIPYMLAIKLMSDDRTFTVQTQDPRIPADNFDLVVPPMHDMLAGPGVEPIIGSPNRITAPRLKHEAERVAPKFAHLPRPLVAVLIGGKSKAYRFPTLRMEMLCEDLGALTRKYQAGLAITTSRRTDKNLIKLLRKRMKKLPAYIWDGHGHNPYFGMLGLADHILVTADSTNMVTEAAATGKPVHIIGLPGGNAKFKRFHTDMVDYGATRPFDGSLGNWTYRPLNETARIANIIRQQISRQS